MIDKIDVLFRIPFTLYFVVILKIENKRFIDIAKKRFNNGKYYYEIF